MAFPIKVFQNVAFGPRLGSRFLPLMVRCRRYLRLGVGAVVGDKRICLGSWGNNKNTVFENIFCLESFVLTCLYVAWIALDPRWSQLVMTLALLRSELRLTFLMQSSFLLR